jgi:Uma2 family endonuclease
MTFEEAARLDPKEQGGEIVAGRWVPVTRSTWNHGRIVSRVCFILETYLETHPGWTVSAGDPGTKLVEDPPTLRGPDVGLARIERRPRGRGAAGWLEGSPDVVFEVHGDSQGASALAQKALEYLRSGAQMVVVLDPDARSAMVYSPPDHIRVIGPEGEIEGGDVLVEFRVPVAKFFPPEE